jgi:ribosomal protein S18 acetylase RimI-like enzyme
MEKMEEYFRKKGCTASRVEVFEPNMRAHNLYRKLGHLDRVIFMIKTL